VASDKITKLSIGKYHKLEKTPFGNLQSKQKQVVKGILKEEGKIKGY